MKIATHELPPPARLEADAAQMAVEDEEWLETIARRVRDEGVVATAFDAPLCAVIDRQDGRPTLTLDAEGSLVMLGARSRKRIRVTSGEGDSEWVPVDVLHARLGLAHDGEESRFITVESCATGQLGDEKKSPWRLVLELLRPEKPDIGVVFVYAVGIGVLSLTLPIAVQVLVNTVAFGTLLQPILVLSALVGAGLVFAAGLRAIQTWVVEIVQRRLFVRLVSALAERLPRVEVTAFETGRGPDLMNRFFDIFTAQKATSSILVGGVEALLTSLVGLIVLSFYHPILLGFGLVLVGAVSIVFFVLGRSAAETTIKESYAKYAVAGWLEEMARHLFVLKSRGGAETAAQKLDDLASNWLRAREAHFRVFFRQFIGALMVQVIVSVALLAVGGWLVVERELTIGQLVAAELIVSAVVASIAKLANKLETVYDLVAAADKLRTLLALPVERAHGERVALPAGPLAVSLHRVRTRSGALRGIDLDVPAGASMVVRTDPRQRDEIADLLFAIEEPEEGIVRVGGADLRDLDLQSARARTAVVREAEILPGTIADNVRLSAPGLPASEVWAILDMVGLADEVRGFPDGLRTVLPPSGIPLDPSGKLRLTIARALASNPGLLVLDGVLGRLPSSEVRRLTQELGEGRTLLILDHHELPDPGVPGLQRRELAAA
ncbi:MAG: ABC transporter ATP-binding protein [Deltaproteobacteria bacterium]|nr:ABC transporter ATP-binding protein [Deltaproteobacteria bacterium]